MKVRREEGDLLAIDDDELVEVARELTLRPSFSGDEGACAEWLAEYLSDEGVEVELQEVEPGRPNVVATIAGTQSGPTLMFNGHLDIDPVPRGYLHDPWDVRIQSDCLYGHGLQNMKAGVASMVCAAIALKRSGSAFKGTLIVAAVVGELQGGIGTHHLLSRSETPDLAIVPEPSNLNVRTVHSGHVVLLIRVRGKSGWIGGMHAYETVDAIDKMVDVRRNLRGLVFKRAELSEVPGLPRHLFGTIIGGLGDPPFVGRPSYVAEDCFMTMEVRVPPNMGMRDCVRDVDDVLSQMRMADPTLNVSILEPPAAYRDPWNASPFFCPALNLSTDEEIVDVVAKTHQRVSGRQPGKIGVEDPGSFAWSDAGHLFEAGTKVVVYGPTKGMFRESYVELGKLRTHARVLLGCALELLGRD